MFEMLDGSIARLYGSCRRTAARSLPALLLAFFLLAGFLSWSERVQSVGSISAEVGAECHQQGVRFRHRECFRLAGGAFVPIYSSHSLDRVWPGVTQVLIILHGGEFGSLPISRLFCRGQALVRSALGASGAASTAIIVPWFPEHGSSDASRWASHKTSFRDADEEVVSWEQGRFWGLDSVTTKRGDSFTTFGILDELVSHLHRKYFFPSLRNVSMTGFSAGCHLLSRWAFFSELASHVRVVVGGCNSFMYLDGRRPAQVCRPLRNTGTQHWCNSFREPHAPSTRYNHYRFGLEMHSRHSAYLARFRGDPAALQKALQAWPSKDVRFLFGLWDVCNCGKPGMQNDADVCQPSGCSGGCCDSGSNESGFLSSFPMMLQGSNRLQRGLNYVAYLSKLYPQRQIPYAFFDGGHSVADFLGARQLREWAVGGGSATVCV